MGFFGYLKQSMNFQQTKIATLSSELIFISSVVTGLLANLDLVTVAPAKLVRLGLDFYTSVLLNLLRLD